jgi:hypothetical protein
MLENNKYASVKEYNAKLTAHNNSQDWKEGHVVVLVGEENVGCLL